MAIDRTVIRYLPYDTLNTSGKIGVRRAQLTGAPGVATAVFPGNGAGTSLAYVYTDGEPIGGWYSSLDLHTAGLSGPVREFEFVLLGADGLTAAPLSQADTVVYVGVGGDSYAVYAGGVVEVGAYVSGVYTPLGSADLGVPFDFDIGWSYQGAFEVALDWSDLPGAPMFWTSLHNAYEV